MGLDLFLSVGLVYTSFFILLSLRAKEKVVLYKQPAAFPRGFDTLKRDLGYVGVCVGIHLRVDLHRPLKRTNHVDLVG